MNNPDSMVAKAAIAVVIPCYKVERHVLDVLAGIGPEVDRIYCVDDACPNSSGAVIAESCKDPRVRVITNPTNQGVGGATMVGYAAALDDGATVVVKVDGDGQMDPALIQTIAWPVIAGHADYAKGNRFFRLSSAHSMPLGRKLGNACLSFLTKLSSGYWNIFDPTNGYTAIHATALRHLPFEDIAKSYFFESDMLYHLNLLDAVVVDVPMDAAYADEESGLRISRILPTFLLGHLRNVWRRILYKYFVRDFSFASINLALSFPMMLFGLVYGILWWVHSSALNVTASAGTVMLAALPLLMGFQMFLSFLQHDVSAVPRIPLSVLMSRERQMDTPKRPVKRKPKAR